MKNLKDDVELSTPKGTMVFTKNEVDTWTGDVNVFDSNNNILNILPLKVGVSAEVDISPDSGLDVIKQSITGVKQLTGKNLVESIKLKQNIQDDKLETQKKTIVEAINEVSADLVLLDDSIGQIGNDIKLNRSDIDSLKFQNFDITFMTIKGIGNVYRTNLVGKITIGTGSLYNSVWSIVGNGNNWTENPNIIDIGTDFYCFPINGEIINDRKLVKGTWTGFTTMKFWMFQGMEISEPNEKTYEIHFYDNVNENEAILSLDVTGLIGAVKKDPKKYGEPINVKMIELENKISKLENFNTELIKLLGVK